MREESDKNRKFQMDMFKLESKQFMDMMQLMITQPTHARALPQPFYPPTYNPQPHTQQYSSLQQRHFQQASPPLSSPRSTSSSPASSQHDQSYLMAHLHDEQYD